MLDNYLRNPLLKKKGAVIEYTEYQVSEILKCYQDIVYFMTHYVYIISLDEGKVLFNPYDYEIDILQTCMKNRFCIFTLSRQLGKTITIGAYLLYMAIFNNDQTIAILANKAEKAQEILSRIKMMFEELPLWLKPSTVKWNERSIKFGNGSTIFSSATTESSIRGYSISILYLDEFAFVQNDVKFYTSSYPVIVSGTNTKIIITSTPNGMNLFAKLWTDAINGRNSYAHLLYTWDAHPHRGEAWKNETIRNTSQQQFLQEHECVRGDTLVTIKNKRTGMIEDIKIEDLYNRINK